MRLGPKVLLASALLLGAGCDSEKPHAKANEVKEAVKPKAAKPAAKIGAKSDETPMLGRCHMDECSWSLERGRVSVAKRGRAELFRLTLLGGSSPFGGDDTDENREADIVWNSAPHEVYILCSSELPVVMMAGDPGEEYQLDVLDFVDGIPGVLESAANLYVGTCHPGHLYFEDGFERRFGYTEMDSEVTYPLKRPEDIFLYLSGEKQPVPATSFTE